MTEKSADKWLATLSKTRGDRQYEIWLERSREILDRYSEKRLDHNDPNYYSRGKRFNILWSNTETMLPALYSKTPTVDVSRRFRDENPIAAEAATILERSLSFVLDDYDFSGVIRNALKDYVLLGRGVVRVDYKAMIEGSQKEETAAKDAEDYDEAGEGEETGEAAEAQEPEEKVAYERALCYYVNWSDFLHSPARTWEEVEWVAFRAFMTDDDFKKRFGEKASEYLRLAQDLRESRPSSTIEDRDGAPEQRREVWEIWDKLAKKVYWVIDGLKDFLDSDDPHLCFANFFPCPRPLLGTITTRSIIPTPEFIQYQDQADEIDLITDRLQGMANSLRVVGAYDKSQEALANILRLPDNALQPVDNWPAIAQAGGLQGVMSFLPIQQNVSAFQALSQARDQSKSEIYELTGISDLFRGIGDPNATATAERIKGSFGSLRLREKQEDVARFVRDLVRMKAEIISEGFSLQTLQAITGNVLLTEQQKSAGLAAIQSGQVDPNSIPREILDLAQRPTWEQVISLLRDDRLRSFNVDIETDSTLTIDRQQELAELTRFVEQVGGVLRQAQEALPAAPELAMVGLEVVSEMVARFKLSRNLEAKIRPVIESLRAKVSTPPQQQQDPNALAQQQQLVQGQQQKQAAEIETELARAESLRARAQADIVKAQSEVQSLGFEQQKAANDAILAQRRFEIDQRELDLRELEIAARQEKARFDYAREIENIKLSYAQLPVQQAEVASGNATNL